MGSSDPSLPLFLTAAHTVVERQRAAFLGVAIAEVPGFVDVAMAEIGAVSVWASWCDSDHCLRW